MVIAADSRIAVASWTITGTLPFGFSFRNSGVLVSPFLMSSLMRSHGTASSSSTSMVRLAVDMGA